MLSHAESVGVCTQINVNLCLAQSCAGAAFNPGGVDRIDYVRDATEINNLTRLDGENCSAVGNARLRQVRDCAVERCRRCNSKLWWSRSEMGLGLVGRQTKKLEGGHRSDGDQNCCIPSVNLRCP